MGRVTTIYILTLVLMLRKGNSFKEAIFHRQPGKYLANHVIRTERTKSEFECSRYCSIENTCVSVNYKRSGHNQGLCELNDAMCMPAESQILPEFNYLSIVYRSCKEGEVFSEESKKCVPQYESCKEIFDKDGSRNNDVYQLENPTLKFKYPVYCHMTAIPECGAGGWTLVMKINGRKQTFAYNSLYWNNNKTYQQEEGLNGLTEKESKLGSYWNTPFKKICLGMKVDGVTKWIKVNYEATSLHSVLADGVFRKTNVTRPKWKSLINNSVLQPHCNEEGFNIQYTKLSLRVGIAGNNEDNCDSCDSWFGFGSNFEGCGESPKITCGNVALCVAHKKNEKRTPGFGFLLVQ